MSGVRVRDFFYVGLPKVVNGTVSLGINLFLAHHFAPGEFGPISFCLNYLLLMDALVGSALDLAVSAKITGGGLDDAITAAEKAGILWKLAGGGAAYVAIALSGGFLGDLLFRRGDGGDILQLWVATGTTMLLIRSLQLYLQSRSLFRAYGLSDLFHTTLRVSFVGAVILTGKGSASTILWSYLLAGVTVLTTAGVLLSGQLRWSRTPVNLADMRELLTRSIPTVTTLGLSIIAARIDLLFVAVRGGPEALGRYSAAMTVALIPEIVASYVGPVLLPKIYPACQSGSIGTLFRRTLRIAAIACVAAFLLGIVLAPAFAKILGPRYGLSVDLLPILLIGTAALSSIFPLTLNFLLLQNPKSVLWIDLIAVPAMSACFWYLIPVHGVVAAAWVTTSYRVARTILLQTIGWSKAGRLFHAETSNA